MPDALIMSLASWLNGMIFKVEGNGGFVSLFVFVDLW